MKSADLLTMVKIKPLGDTRSLLRDILFTSYLNFLLIKEADHKLNHTASNPADIKLVDWRG